MSEPLFVLSGASLVALASQGPSRRGRVEETECFGLLHDARTEPRGQKVARLQSSDGAIIGLSYVLSMHSQTEQQCLKAVPRTGTAIYR